MTTGGAELLRILGSGVVPDGASAQAPASVPVQGMDFGSLLAKAESGAAPSGRRIDVARDAGVTLSGGQLERLARVADAAEAAGSTRLLALIDGQAVIVNVVTRTVEGTFDPTGKTGADAVLTGVDAAVIVPGGEQVEEETAPGRGAFGGLGVGPTQALGPPAGVGNRSLADLIEAMSRSKGSSAA